MLGKILLTILIIVVSIPVLFIVLVAITNIWTKANAIRQGKNIISQFYNLLMERNYVVAATFLSKSIISNDLEKLNWINNITNKYSTQSINEFSIGTHSFGSITGRYVQQVFFKISISLIVSGKIIYKNERIRLVEENVDEWTRKLKIIECPEFSDEEKARIEESLLSIRPQRKQST